MILVQRSAIQGVGVLGGWVGRISRCGWVFGGIRSCRVDWLGWALMEAFLMPDGLGW